jgi:hypothetical protein
MKCKRLTILALAAIMTMLVLLLLTGCPQHIDSLYGLKVTGDRAGGAIAIYEDKLGGNIYVQKISPDGKTLWGEKGVFLGNSDSKAYSFTSIDIVSDASGGAIVAWPESSENQFRPTSHLARVDAKGNWSGSTTSFISTR